MRICMDRPRESVSLCVTLDYKVFIYLRNQQLTRFWLEKPVSLGLLFEFFLYIQALTEASAARTPVNRVSFVV